MKNELINIYTDGASRGNPGPGGWGAIIDFGETISEIGGRESKTTNNRMELSAVLESLEYLENKGYSSSQVMFFTDSSYVANGVSVWINGWRRNNWKSKTGSEIANIDLWQKIDDLLNVFEVKMTNIEGHVGIPANERADVIATSFADDKPDNLFVGKKSMYQIDLSDMSKNSEMKKTKSRSNAKAYSYLSLVDGVLQIHKTWADCEARVKGQKGVKFKKALSKEDEDSIKKSWGY
jgi:ribonuclease HI